MTRRRYVARGIQGGYRIRDNKARRWWGELYELCPDELLAELNGGRDYEKDHGIAPDVPCSETVGIGAIGGMSARSEPRQKGHYRRLETMPTAASTAPKPIARFQYRQEYTGYRPCDR